MYVAEKADGILIVSITGIPGASQAHVWTQVYHPERTGSRGKEKPPGIGSIHKRIYQIYGLLAQGNISDREAKNKHSNTIKYSFHFFNLRFRLYFHIFNSCLWEVCQFPLSLSFTPFQINKPCHPPVPIGPASPQTVAPFKKDL